MKRALTFVVGLLPHCRLKIWLLQRLFGPDVDRSAHVGPVALLRVDRLRLGPGSTIGFGNIFRDLGSLEVGTRSRIGNWNWISAAPPLMSQHEHSGRFALGDESAVTSRHYFDSSGGIIIGDYCTIAGVRSVFLTHGIDTVTNSQQAEAIVVRDYSLISSNVLVAAGSHIGSACHVAMGAVIPGMMLDDGWMYAGVPARQKRPTAGNHFRRTTGFVSPATDETPPG